MQSPTPSFSTSLVIACLLCITATPVLRSQSQVASDSAADTRSLPQTVWYDITTALTHGMRLGTLTAYDDHTEWTYIGLTTAATLTTFAVDAEFRSMIQRQQESTMRDITASGDFLGSWGSPIIGGGFYLAGLAAGDEWTRVTGRLALEAIAYAGITTSVIKSVSGRSRPYLEQGAFDYTPWQFNTDRTALPSGHATMIWSLASVLDARIDHPAASVLVYSAALVTMAHRWHHDSHWLSDTILGAAIGWGIGRAVVAMEEHQSATDAPVQTSVIPVLAPGTAGLHLVVLF